MKLKHDVRVLEMCTNDIRETTSKRGKFYLFDGSGIKNWEHDNLAPNTRYVILCVPIEDGMRLAVDGDNDPRLGNLKCLKRSDGYHVKSKGLGWTGHGLLSAGDICITPIKSERDTKREALQAKLEEAEATIAAVRDELGALA